jgi:hypothetical protein
MNEKPNSPASPPDRAGRTLIKAFAFAGAILGVGAIGLVKTAILFGRELGWITTEPHLGAALWWILGGALLGGVAGGLLVTLRRRW